MILAGDIGGTNVRLAYFEVSGGRLVSTFTEIHPTREFASLEEAARKFLSAHSLKIECACFGVAGAVKHGKVKLTNLPWTLDERLLARNLGVEQMWLINDLEANAEGVAALSPDDFLVLNQGEAGGSDNCAIISAGTGLGEAGLVWDGVRRRPVASGPEGRARPVPGRRRHASSRAVEGPGLTASRHACVACGGAPMVRCGLRSRRHFT